MERSKATVDRFRGTIRILGVNPYVLISVARAKRLKPGWRKPLPVLIRINGQPEVAWRINLMPVGDGRFYLYLHESVRRKSGTRVGDRVDVELRFDAAYRNGPMHAMPSWFRLALAKNPVAQRVWKALSPSRQKEVLRYFDRLKSPEARARNLERALSALSGEPGRFMGRDWEDGS